MTKELFDSLPYSSINELIKLRNYFKKVSSAHLSLINEIKSNDESVLYEFKEILNGYAFVISNLQYDESNKKNSYTVYWRPTSAEEIKGYNISVEYNQIDTLFTKWIENIQNLNRIKFEYLNPDEKFYDKQFSDFFTNNDEDSLINPFEIERQEILYHFLTYAENQIRQETNIDDHAKTNLLKQTSDLKEDIPKSTKKKIVFCLSKFAQSTKKVSNKLFHEIFDVLKKELIKKVLFEGAAQIPNAINKIEHWIHLLNS